MIRAESIHGGRLAVLASVLLALAALWGCSGDDGARSEGDAVDAANQPDPGLDAGGADTRLEPTLLFLDEEGAPVNEIRYGDLFVARATGLTPGEEVTIRASMQGFRSHAVFVADANGTVDLSRDAPKRGTYSGVDPEGLVWSMVRQSNDKGTDYDVRLVVERAGKPIVEGTIARRPLDARLDVAPVSSDGVVGLFYTPAGSTAPRATVLVLGGSEGGVSYASFWAAYVASLGYSALALAYFGVDTLPASLAEIPLEYFESALGWLAKQPQVDAKRIAVAGVSRGGELALVLGARYPAVKGVIAEVGSGVRWGAAGVVGKAAWTLGGKPLPHIPGNAGGKPRAETLPSGKTAYRMTPTFEAALAATDPSALSAATTAVEKIDGPVLLIAGKDDGLWPSCKLSKIAMDRRVQHAHTAQHADVFLCLEDAGHIIGPPGWPTTETYVVVSPSGYYSVMGGTPAGTARAQRAADGKLRAFLEALASR